MASSKQQKKARGRQVAVASARPLVLVVGALQVRERFVRDLVERLHRHAGVPPATTVHRDDVVIAGARYFGANAAHHFQGMHDVDGVVVLHGADPDVVAEAHRRLLRTRRLGPERLLPHQMRFLDESAVLLPHQQRFLDEVAASRANNPEGYAVGPDRFIRIGPGERVEAVPPPPVSVDVAAIWRMGEGERAKVLRLLGAVLRPFCPEAGDLLDEADGVAHGQVPDLPPQQAPPVIVNHPDGEGGSANFVSDASAPPLSNP